MEKKGLCVTCENDKGCTFPRKFPVWQCEEFSSENNVPTSFKPVKTKRVVSREVAIESE